jgi:hypothetical protein
MVQVHAPANLQSESAGYSTRDHSRVAFVGLFLCALIASLAIYLQNTTPEPLPESSPPPAFSAARALRHLEVISNRPHPIGSREHAVVGDYIVSELSRLGLESQIQETTAINSRRGPPFNAGVIKNVVARLRGTENSRAILLSSHYDSVPTSPGASDDGAGVVALLETARALKADAPLKNDVIFLFTDGEEVGLLGAEAFVSEHPWAKDIGLILNFEARGNSGPSLMFETSGGNSELIDEFARAAPHPAADSFFYEIYKRLPNDTDFTVLKRMDAGGLNFAFANGISHYHTLLDNTQNIDHGSIQHQGSYALALTRHFGYARIDNSKAAANAVYFNVLGSIFVHYSSKWIIPLLGLTTIVFGLLLVQGFRKRELTILGLFLGFLGILASIIVSVVSISLTWLLVRLVQPAYRAVPWGEPYNNNSFRIAFVLLTIAITSTCFMLLRKKVSVQNLSVGALLWWLILSIVVCVAMPGGSYLFTLPLLFVLVAWVLSGVANLGHSAKSQLLLIILTIPGVVLLAPVIYTMFVGLTLNGAAIIGIFIVLLCALLMPLILAVTDAKGWMCPALLMLGSVGLIIMGIAGSGFERHRPKINSVLYAFNADTGQAVWASSDEREDDWTGQFFKPGAQRQSMAEYFPGSTKAYLKSSAPVVQFAAPEAKLIDEQGTTSDLRTVSFHVSSPRQASVISIYTEPDVEVLYASANGKEARRSNRNNSMPNAPVKYWGLHFYGLAEQGIDVVLKTRSGKPLKVLLVDLSRGLPEIPGTPIKARADEMIPNPHSSGDATLVAKWFVF